MNFEKVLKEIGQFFEQEGTAFAIIGAFALHAYGLTRATRDLDFVTDIQVQEKLIRFLEELGYETIHASKGYSNHLHTDPAKGRIDFVYISGETSRQLLGSAIKNMMVGKTAIPVPRAEYLAAMKIQAMKNDPERTFQEMADIQFLMRLPGIDRNEIKGYFEKQGLLDKYNEIKEIIEAF
ncbi:MAG: nucleotidyl transferase AbiEii/AbiGii toxin family protein [Acidobacteria bacterium]|nr:nucleotidyl transferase AbiEii/AbiGii toxin family protein [Acidobacteriota bacterium]